MDVWMQPAHGAARLAARKLRPAHVKITCRAPPPAMFLEFSVQKLLNNPWIKAIILQTYIKTFIQNISL